MEIKEGDKNIFILHTFHKLGQCPKHIQIKCSLIFNILCILIYSYFFEIVLYWPIKEKTLQKNAYRLNLNLASYRFITYVLCLYIYTLKHIFVTFYILQFRRRKLQWILLHEQVYKMHYFLNKLSFVFLTLIASATFFLFLWFCMLHVKKLKY